MKGMTCLQLHPTHPLIYTAHDIIVIVKKLLKVQQCYLGGRISYKTLAIRLLYLCYKSSIAAAILH